MDCFCLLSFCFLAGVEGVEVAACLDSRSSKSSRMTEEEAWKRGHVVKFTEGQEDGR
jgi:hypothetical protein